MISQPNREIQSIPADIRIAMSHSILLTGASGYLGGSLLAQLSHANLPPYKHLYALARSESQAASIRQYNAEPLILDLSDQEQAIKTIVDAKITIIYFLLDAMKSELQIPLIKALGEVRKQTVGGQDVHFLHTTGAKIFSEHAGMPIDRRNLDTDSNLYELQKSAKAPHSIMAQVRPRYSPSFCKSITNMPKDQVKKLLDAMISSRKPRYWTRPDVTQKTRPSTQTTPSSRRQNPTA